MSVSNVIEVCEGKNKGFYFCNSVGFKPIDFDITRTDHNDMMKILVVENGKTPYKAEIRHDIHAMQSVVEGCIEPIYFEPKQDALVWCNDEFLLNNSEPNRMVGDCLVHGTFYVSETAKTNTANGTAVRLPTSRSRNILKYLKLPLLYLSKRKN